LDNLASLESSAFKFVGRFLRGITTVRVSRNSVGAVDERVAAPSIPN
jgi:hypothetical protein